MPSPASADKSGSAGDKGGPAGDGQVGALSFPPVVSGNPSQREEQKIWIPAKNCGNDRRAGPAGRTKAVQWVDEGGRTKAGPAGNGRIGLLSFPPAVSGNPAQREGERFWIPAKNCGNDRRAGPAGRTKAGQRGGPRRFSGWTKAGGPRRAQRGTDELVFCHSRRRLAGIQRRGRGKRFWIPAKNCGNDRRAGPAGRTKAGQRGGQRRGGGRAKAGRRVGKGGPAGGQRRAGGWAKAGRRVGKGGPAGGQRRAGGWAKAGRRDGPCVPPVSHEFPAPRRSPAFRAFSDISCSLYYSEIFLSF